VGGGVGGVQSVRAKDLAKSLLCHVTRPDRLLCGALLSLSLSLSNHLLSASPHGGGGGGDGGGRSGGGGRNDDDARSAGTACMAASLTPTTTARRGGGGARTARSGGGVRRLEEEEEEERDGDRASGLVSPALRRRSCSPLRRPSEARLACDSRDSLLVLLAALAPPRLSWRSAATAPFSSARYCFRYCPSAPSSSPRGGGGPGGGLAVAASSSRLVTWSV
jgi:hypothetical protein